MPILESISNHAKIASAWGKGRFNNYLIILSLYTMHIADEESHLQRHDRSVSMVMEKVVVPALFLTFSWRQIMMIFQLVQNHDNFSAGAKS